MRVFVTEDEEKSIDEHVSGLRAIFQAEFVAGGKEKYFQSTEGQDISPDSDEVDRTSFGDDEGGDLPLLNSDEYHKMLRAFSDRIVARDGNYQSKIDAYHSNKRNPVDPSIAPLKTLGTDCNVQEVFLAAAQCQERVNSVNGPAAKRRIGRQPRVRIRGLTEGETDVVKNNHREKQLWNQIM
jgi:hypothetical protein